ncbi:hypothetical protein [Photorhabdus aballayi]|uniref:hypothetical protein n=1 Tax=Photorhabdus aballayi TaxID=2991723 RepID=UPI0035E261C8
MTLLNTLSETVNYNRNGELVEFDVEQYFICIKEMINKTAEIGKRVNNENIIQIVLTIQAETLILLDKNKTPIFLAMH